MDFEMNTGTDSPGVESVEVLDGASEACALRCPGLTGVTGSP